MSTGAAQRIRDYLDQHGGRVEVPFHNLLTTWRLAEADAEQRRAITDELARAGVRVDPPLREPGPDDPILLSLAASGVAAADAQAAAGLEPAPESPAGAAVGTAPPRAATAKPAPSQGKGTLIVAGAVALALAAAAGAYALGASSGADLDDARADGERAGHDRGEVLGRRSGYAAGRREGRKAGFRSTYRKAYRRAAKQAQSGVASQRPPPRGQPAFCGPGTVSAANGCVPESQAKCAAYQDFVPGQGCVPPLKPGEIEAKPSCPPGQVPVGVTGACARP